MRMIGLEALFEKLIRLDAVPKQILIGMEATSRYGENKYQEAQGARLSALFVASWPNASVSSAARIARQDRSARCSDHCQGAVEWRSAGRRLSRAEHITTYRELVRLHTLLER